MDRCVCPCWVGYLLLNPLRRLFESPHRLFEGLVSEGMTVLEPGSGMGYFTLALARMVGFSGRVIAVDVEPKMIAALARRAAKAGVSDRIDLRLCPPDRLGVDDLRGRVDFAGAIHVLSETPDQAGFLEEIHRALKSEGRLLLIEPRGHLSKREFERSVALAQQRGFSPDARRIDLKGRRVLFRRGPLQPSGFQIKSA